MQGLTQNITIEGTAFTVRELTVGEIRVWEKKLEAQLANAAGMSATDMLLLEEISLAEMAQMLGMSEADVDTLPPSVLEQLKPACREVNARFFTLRALLIRPLMSALDLLNLAAPSAGLSAPATPTP